MNGQPDASIPIGDATPPIRIVGITLRRNVDATASTVVAFTFLAVGTGIRIGRIAGHDLFLTDAAPVFVAGAFEAVGAARRITRIAFTRLVDAPAIRKVALTLLAFRTGIGNARIAIVAMP